jgi:multidrug efflux pump subunit AcrB
VIVAVLIAIFGAAAIATTPTDILPGINIPIVSVIWSYSGLDDGQGKEQTKKP